MVCYSIGRTSGLLIGPIGDLPEVVMPGNYVSLYADDYKTSRAQLFEGRLALKPGLNLTRVSISFVQKHFLG